MGDVRVEVTYKGVLCQLLFRNAFHAPNVSSNLLSTGYTNTTANGRIVFQNPQGVEIFEAVLERGIYVMNTNPIGSQRPLSNVTQLPVDIWYLHCISGHIMPEAIEMAPKLVDGYPEIKGTRKKMGTCKDCKKAHTDKQPHPESLEKITETNFQWYLDVWGPVQVVSVGGNKYALFGMDAVTSKNMVDFLKDRTAETLIRKLEVCRTEAETQASQKLERIRTDNPPEWRSHAFQAWTSKHGIIHEFTAPYSSASNSAAERSIGIMLNGTQAMLFDTNLPAKWWAHAMSAYIHVISILLNTRGVVPEEQWTGLRQSVSHLVLFGSIGFAHILAKTGRGKLDARGFKCQMVGYEGRKFYLVKWWETDELYWTSDVVFERSEGHWISELEGENNEDLLFLAPTPKSKTPSLDQPTLDQQSYPELTSVTPPATDMTSDEHPPIPNAPQK
ncbi:hypothetical protein D9758_004532 [Tetrapyrgos nigripes]|uniref:Integrase catalytic domain-containing protein n=1 Tax=Tetrapyrgos nigripes TaxID=182062 RepID=A0A8H5H098_9AGAR|nr:hypothetical protein D9758_004532 [Tetrapyrgos nigripes]